MMLDQAINASGTVHDRLTARTVAILFFCAFFMLIEGLDLAAMPLAVPRVSAQWGQPPSAFALSLSAVLIGIGLASVLLAPLGERFGRKRMIVWTGMLAAGATFGTATADNVSAFVVWRLLTGIGLGACLPNVTASVARIAPMHMRARILAIVNTAIPVGSVMAALIVAPVVRIGNWQALFVIAGLLTLIAIAGLVILMPSHQQAIPSSSTTTRRQPSASPLFELFLPAHRIKTLLLLGLATTNTFLIYMMINWLPTLLPRGGMPVDTAARLSGLFQFGGIVGGFFFAYQLDRGRAVRTFVGGYLCAAAGLIGIAVTAYSGTLWALLLLAIGVGISGAHIAITIFGMIFYPQHLLSSFVGLSIAVTRSGAICGPLAGGWLVAHVAGVGGFMLAALIPVALCIAWVLIIGRAERTGIMALPTITKENCDRA